MPAGVEGDAEPHWVFSGLWRYEVRREGWIENRIVQHMVRALTPAWLEEGLVKLDGLRAELAQGDPLEVFQWQRLVDVFNAGIGLGQHLVKDHRLEKRAL